MNKPIKALSLTDKTPVSYEILARLGFKIVDDGDTVRHVYEGDDELPEPLSLLSDKLDARLENKSATIIDVIQAAYDAGREKGEEVKAEQIRIALGVFR